MNDVIVIHKGKVENGKIIFDLPKMFEAKKEMLEGKRFDMTLEIEHEKVTNSQWAYYYGGIIKGTCLKTETFAAWTADDVHEAIVGHLRNNVKVIIVKGKEIVSNVPDDIKLYNKSQMATYIEDVINFLATMDIYPLPPDNYKYNNNLIIRRDESS